MMMNVPVYTLPETPIHVCILKRPSAFCKTPYVADIMVDNIPHMAHCPALGCCGLSDKASQVYVVPISNNKSTKNTSKPEPKCTYRVELAVYEERNQTVLVGINPKLAETLMDRLLTSQMCPFLPNIQSYGREKKYLNSRFDFAGIDQDGRPFVMEIKNVPLADYVDVPKKERKKYQTDHMPFHEKIAYFPDGYRKNSTEVVSPRALKHIQELETILQNEKTSNPELSLKTRAILCFMVQRPDVAIFQPSNIDLTYKAAVKQAVANGVEVYAIQMEWNTQGECRFGKLLEVRLDG